MPALLRVRLRMRGALGLALAVAGPVRGGQAGAGGAAAELAGRLQRAHLVGGEEAAAGAAHAPRRVIVPRLVQVRLHGRHPMVMVHSQASVKVKLCLKRTWATSVHHRAAAAPSHMCGGRGPAADPARVVFM